MVIYFDMNRYSGQCCFRNDVLMLLRENGYTIYTSRGTFLKVDTLQKSCFGSPISERGSKVFSDKSSWIEIRRAVS